MTTSAGSLDRRLYHFAVDAFQRGGGVVDWDENEPSGIVVVPADLAEKAGLPGEEFTLGATSGAANLQVGLASDFLDVATRTLDAAVPRQGAFGIADRYLTNRDLADKIEQAFTWQNARAKVRAAEPGSAEYHIWTLHASLRSEDVWESVFEFAVNSRSLSIIDLPDVFREHDLVPRPPAVEQGGPGGPGEQDEPATYTAAVKEGKRRLVAASGEYVERIEGRLARDRKRLQDYYKALAREADGTKRRSTAAPLGDDEIAARKRAVDLELRRKLAELNENYALRAELLPVVLVRVTLPVLEIPVVIQRKQAVRIYHLYWNSLLKQLEPLACGRCGQATWSGTFTDDTVDLLCTPCASVRK